MENVEKAVTHCQEKNSDFIDGYIAAVMERRNIPEIFSYGKKHPAWVTDIKRREP